MGSCFCSSDSPRARYINNIGLAITAILLSQSRRCGDKSTTHHILLKGGLALKSSKEKNVQLSEYCILKGYIHIGGQGDGSVDKALAMRV